MPINQQLLEKARAAGATLADAERQVQLARTEYHAMIRRMHLAGGSLRELAHALELSHQRVQQMVEGAGGSWWHRVWRSRNARHNLICTYCGRTEEQASKLIAGPGVFICDACVALAQQTITGNLSPATRDSLALAPEHSKARCSFCRKRRTADRQLLISTTANICSECLHACRQILADSTP
jgi:ClpX C4-type zinc finger